VYTTRDGLFASAPVVNSTSPFIAQGGEEPCYIVSWSDQVEQGVTLKVA
jgi:hypothetical protein